jgi:8-oxo-dGTP diphosphatase
MGATGGKLRWGEAPHEAALRELEEETMLLANDLMYLFQFSGLSRRHIVFFVDVAQYSTSQASNEIAKVRVVVLTRENVELFCQHIGVLR